MAASPVGVTSRRPRGSARPRSPPGSSPAATRSGAAGGRRGLRGGRRLHHEPRPGRPGPRLARAPAPAGRARAVVVNAGCANAATGEARPRGRPRDGRGRRAELWAVRPRRCWWPPPASSACPCPWTRSAPASPRRRGASRATAGPTAARAIMTTDTKPKEVVVEFAGRRTRRAHRRDGQGRRA